MARQLRIPVAVPTRHPENPNTCAVLTVDLVALKRTKSFAKLCEATPEWSNDQRIDYLLSLMCEGPA